ncbi:hypothetical protein [Cohnella sp.]|uniref:hypothetical protein n=1 Tax=Cohnella sp. TaxID=1883426 RepID=UPI003567AEF8
MRKYRSWLMGLGVGLIIGASMLQVILMAKDQSVMVEEQSLTREQLDETAKKSGLVLLTTDQLEAKVDEAVTAALEEASNDESAKIDETQGDLKLSPLETNDAENSPTPSETADSSKPAAGSKGHREVTIYIPYKMNLTEVADKLQVLGVIEDADDFVTKAWSISKKLSVGTSIFKENSTYKQIMDELTRTKED